MIDPAFLRHPAMNDLVEATRRLENAERARAQALRAWEVSDEPYPLNAAIALEATERDLRLARAHLDLVQKALHAAVPVAGAGKEEGEEAWGPDDKSWGSH